MRYPSPLVQVPAPLKVDMEYSTYSTDLEKRFVTWLDSKIAAIHHEVEEMLEGLRGTQHLPRELYKLRTAADAIETAMSEATQNYKREVKTLTVRQTEMILYSVNQITRNEMQQRSIYDGTRER